MKKIALKLLIFTFVISAILGISIIFLDLWNDITLKILLSTAIIFYFSIPGLACSANYEKSESKIISILGMLTCVLSCLFCLCSVWEFLEDFSWEFLLTCILISSSFGHICLLQLINSDEKVVHFFKNGTIILSVVIDFLLIIEIYEGGIEWKLLSSIAILIVLGTIVSPILNKINTKKEFSNDIQNDKYIKLGQIKKLLDTNAITQEEYDIEKTKILNTK